MKISYAITVNDELEEIQNLISWILKYKKGGDEIVVLQDIETNEKCSIKKTEVYQYLMDLYKDDKIIYNAHPLNNDFATQKNYLNSKCTGDYIFQLDADETVSSFFMDNIHELLKLNTKVDAYWIPRINIVEGITENHIKRWGWTVNDKEYINYPDFQLRLFSNNPNIKWERKVHEQLVGYKFVSHLPQEEEWSIVHKKTINKQEQQNKMYEMIMRNPNIHNRGYWLTKDKTSDTFAQGTHLHKYDIPLSNELAKLFKEKTVVDLGCGLGQYINNFKQNDIKCEGYDGNPNTPELTGNICKVLDLSLKQDLNKKFDWVLSIEVGEHIPKKYERIYIENLIRHCKEGIVLSWAVPGQGGVGHFNEQPNDYIRKVFEMYDMVRDIEIENKLRRAAGMWWFKNTIMVFKKKMDGQ